MIRGCLLILLAVCAACSTGHAVSEEGPATVYTGNEQKGEYLFTVRAGTTADIILKRFPRHTALRTEQVSETVILVCFTEDPGSGAVEGVIDGTVITAAQPNYRYRKMRGR